MRFAAALSTEEQTQTAVQEVCRAALAQLGGPPDLAVVFASHHHAAGFSGLARQLARRLGGGALIGCSGESIVGTGREIEDAPALSLWLAQLPGVRVEPLHLRFAQTAEGPAFQGWPETLPARWPQGATLLLLAEPFSFPADVWLARLNEDQPGAQVLGGMASGGWNPGQNRLFLGDAALDEGAVGAWLCGPVQVRGIVSQGCRPVGRAFVVTRAQRNVIHELGGKPALAQLQEIFDALPPEDQQRVREGIHVGRVIDEYRQEFRRGDFLIRNVVGADAQSGAIAIGDFVRAGQTVQFHVRDAQSADDDLRELAAQATADLAPRTAAGALVFTCNGRGTRLFAQPHHDAALIQRQFGDIPVAGLFAQGEIGPIGHKNFVHGFTACVALFG
jgi:small ligand-binding sensory domain FIST